MANDIISKSSGSNLLSDFVVDLNQLSPESKNSLAEYIVKKQVDLATQAKLMSMKATAAQTDLENLKQAIKIVEGTTSANVKANIEGASGTTTVNVHTINWWGK